MKLRPYQQQAVDSVMETFESPCSSLIVLATGCGKTVIASHIAERMKNHGRMMFIAHREELLTQAADKLYRVCGERAAIEMADQWSDERGLYEPSRFVVSSVQTQNAGSRGEGRMARFLPSDFALLTIDEAHHATASTYRRVIDHYRQNEEIRVLGMTATPDRHDEEALGHVFDNVAFEYDVRDAVSDGWLVPIHQQMIVVDGLDFSQCKTTAGDLNGADLARVMEYEANLHGIVDPTVEIVSDRKTLVFAASVAHAERIAEIFNRHRPDSAFVLTGKTPKDQRRDYLDRFRSGDFRYMVNVGVATEGFDVPDIECVVMARPTKSRALYSQMLGRGTRPIDGLVDPFNKIDDRRQAIEDSMKPSMLVLDFVGNAGRHKLIASADVLGGKYSDDIVAIAKQEMERSGRPSEVTEALEIAEKEAEKRAREEAERNRRLVVKGKAKFSRKSVSPFDVLEISAHRVPGWFTGKPATEKQVALLDKFGIKEPEKLNIRHASQLIDTIFRRMDQKKCSFKQAKLLRQYGYSPDVSFVEAGNIITQLKANGWKKPASEMVPA